MKTNLYKEDSSGYEMNTYFDFAWQLNSGKYLACYNSISILHGLNFIIKYWIGNTLRENFGMIMFSNMSVIYGVSKIASLVMELIEPF